MFPCFQWISRLMLLPKNKRGKKLIMRSHFKSRVIQWILSSPDFTWSPCNFYTIGHTFFLDFQRDKFLIFLYCEHSSNSLSWPSSPGFSEVSVLSFYCKSLFRLLSLSLLTCEISSTHTSCMKLSLNPASVQTFFPHFSKLPRCSYLYTYMSQFFLRIVHLKISVSMSPTQNSPSLQINISNCQITTLPHPGMSHSTHKPMSET